MRKVQAAVRGREAFMNSEKVRGIGAVDRIVTLDPVNGTATLSLSRELISTL